MEAFDLILALVLCICWSSMYNVSVPYEIVEQIIIGFSMAYTITVEATNFRNWIINPLSKATPDLTVLIPLIIGLMYFTVLYRPLIRVFRAAVTLTVAVNLALAFAGAGVGQYSNVTAFGYMKSATDIIPFILYAAGLCYMTFSAKLSRLSTTYGMLGRFGIFTFFAVTCYGNLFCGLIQSTGYMYMVLTGTAWFILPLVFLLCLLHGLGVYKRLGLTLERPAKAEEPT